MSRQRGSRALGSDGRGERIQGQGAPPLSDRPVDRLQLTIHRSGPAQEVWVDLLAGIIVEEVLNEHDSETATENRQG